jgi:hypothetical protein
LMTLCENAHACHFVFGHLYNWLHYNDNIETDAPYWSGKFVEQVNKSK